MLRDGVDATEQFRRSRPAGHGLVARPTSSWSLCRAKVEHGKEPRSRNSSATARGAREAGHPASRASGDAAKRRLAADKRTPTLLAKGALGLAFILTTDDCQKTYDELVARGIEFTEEPTERFYGIDCGVRDPFGNQLRITQPAPAPIQAPTQAT